MTSGAQTERRGQAGPVRLLLGGKDSPAAFSRSVFFASPRGQRLFHSLSALQTHSAYGF